VESTPGAGSTFWFVIPLLADTDAAAVPAPFGGHRPPPPAPGAATVGRARGTVLVVEDNPINQLVAVSLLEARGFTVDVAGNGLEALEHHGRRAYRAIFMDGHMPELDGYQATAEIRRREDDSCHTPIVALTAGATPEDRRRCLAAGMDDYLSKPVNQKQLDLVLERLVEGDAPIEA
jgi:CheY-like chemotaxis protein